MNWNGYKLFGQKFVLTRPDIMITDLTKRELIKYQSIIGFVFCLEPRTSFTKNLDKQSCSGNLSHHVMDLGNSYISILRRLTEWSVRIRI